MPGGGGTVPCNTAVLFSIGCVAFLTTVVDVHTSIDLVLSSFLRSALLGWGIRGM
jgi:hypothetical protein